MRRADKYQWMLILSGILVTALFGVFLYREIFPEYKIYQKDYIALEQFRSTYTHQPPPPFQTGIKQIVIEREDRGPPVIDRCTSCHVALQIPYFSPTKISHDINGNIIRDANGRPLLVPNEEYIWDKLDQAIAALRDEKVNEQLIQEGREDEVQRRLNEADRYASLKVAHIGHYVYDVTKALVMHPLIGKETRPFEFHPIEEFGCVSCHNGNGRGLTTDKAHGPVFDEQYEVEYRGPKPHFIDRDPENDPSFAYVFNEKPGSELLFQTDPLFVGPLIQAKCVQCHQTSDVYLETIKLSNTTAVQKREKQFKDLQESFERDKRTLITLIDLKEKIEKEGYQQTLENLKERQATGIVTTEQLAQLSMQINELESLGKGVSSEEETRVIQGLNQQIITLLGSEQLEQALQETYQKGGEAAVDPFLQVHRSDPQATGSLFVKAEVIDYQQDLIRHLKENENALAVNVQDEKTAVALETDVDELTRNYQRGKELYLSQACYACHRIAGFARGGVGPELTRIGTQYPWYIKESITWPQADLATSTMPNMRLDHRELQDLMTYLLAQRGATQTLSAKGYKEQIQSWEAGRKLSWEEPISPAQMHNLRYAMTLFATEGCAACHRLMGFESNVGFKIEKESPSPQQLYAQQQWFKKIFPETIRIAQYDQELPGAALTAQIEKYAQEIDERIASDVRKHSILEEINDKHPQAIEALYSSFRYASRAKDHHYRTLMDQAPDEARKGELKAEWVAWKERVHRVLMIYIQQYGFGRLICPRPNWSGVFRTDEWLMEHFHNPAVHVPRSIMPVMPFDDTKFYALTYMLDRLGVRNRDAVRQIWEVRGFDPAEAYATLCAQCHGISFAGNGPVSEWIYPIPKSLRNPDFLRNLTRERAIDSIIHGVKGTPMPPWGEVARDKPENIKKMVHDQPVLTEAEIHRLVDWLFNSLSGSEVIRSSEDVLKWQYEPRDVIDELIKEGGRLESLPPSQSDVELKERQRNLPEKELPQENVRPPADEDPTLSFLPTGEGYYAAIRPEVYSKNLPQGERQLVTVEEIFDQIPSTGDQPDPYHYYIKKRYYTPFNLEQGQKFFLLNCAVCHGNEGDGSGSRSSAMQEAKPRMLTNLDWVNSRDDLRLLRSIKYGVPGTSMTPWGDLTSSLQRLQLVMFIRSLTQQRAERSRLDTLLYQTFDSSLLTIENARIGISQQIEKVRKQLDQLQQRQRELDYQLGQGKSDEQELIKNYQQMLESQKELQEWEQKDQLLIEMAKAIRREHDLYSTTGFALIGKGVSDALLSRYLDLIKLNQGRYSLEGDQLKMDLDPNFAEPIRQKRQEILQELDQRIFELEQRERIIEGRIRSAERTEDLKNVKADLLSYQKLRTELITSTEDAIKMAEKQRGIYQQFNQQQLSSKQQEKH